MVSCHSLQRSSLTELKELLMMRYVYASEQPIFILLTFFSDNFQSSSELL